MLWICTDWRVDWNAVSAIVAGASAMAAAWAAWEARRAAKVALQIDAKVAERVADRERRDAIPLAIAIQRELFQIQGLMRRLPEMNRLSETQPKAEILREITQGRSRFEAHVLAASIRNLGCFDIETGRALAMALSATQAFQGMLDTPPPEMSEDSSRRALDLIAQNSQHWFPIVRAGAAVLEPLTGIAVPDPQS